MKLLKERVLNRRKAYNLCQLVDFLVVRLTDYFEKKLIDVANNRLAQHALTSRFYPDHRDIDSEDVVKVNNLNKHTLPPRDFDDNVILGRYIAYIM